MDKQRRFTSEVWGGKSHLFRCINNATKKRKSSKRAPLQATQGSCVLPPTPPVPARFTIHPRPGQQHNSFDQTRDRSLFFPASRGHIVEGTATSAYAPYYSPSSTSATTAGETCRRKLSHGDDGNKNHTPFFKPEHYTMMPTGPRGLRPPSPFVNNQ